MVREAYIGGERMKEDYEPKKIITFFNFFIDIKNKVKGWLGIERD